MNVLSGRTFDSSLKLSGLVQFDGQRFDIAIDDFRPAVGTFTCHGSKFGEGSLFFC